MRANESRIICRFFHNKQGAKKSTFGLNASGFTLIEILVVLTILSIVAGMVALSINHLTRASTFDETAERLVAQLRFAQDVAILQGQTIALNVHLNSYDFSFRTPSGWQVLENGPLAGTQKLSAGISLALQVKHSDIAQNSASLYFSPNAVPLTDILLLAQGPLRMEIAQNSAGEIVSSNK